MELSQPGRAERAWTAVDRGVHQATETEVPVIVAAAIVIQSPTVHFFCEGKGHARTVITEWLDHAAAATHRPWSGHEARRQPDHAAGSGERDAAAYEPRAHRREPAAAQPADRDRIRSRTHRWPAHRPARSCRRRRVARAARGQAEAAA